ncbi:hypothetical protein J4465_02560 [Candidatus Pacearchaeota archaeon]|nr:hypothetical protein [Candidatus Pacearchaeota archaeon]
MLFKRGFSDKRGQLTTFIILAIVIIALGVLVSLFWPKISGYFMNEDQASSMLASQSESLRTSVSDCTKEVSTDIIERIGLQAGFYDYSHLYSINFAGPKVVVMFKDVNKNRVNKLPTTTEISNEFKKAMEEEGYARIDACLNDFSGFKRNMDVVPGERKITLSIEDEKAIISVDWPITVSKQTVSTTITQQLKQNDVQLLIPFGRIWKVANDIVNTEVQQKNFIDELDNYILTHTYSLAYTRLNSQNYPTDRKTVYYLTSIPYREGEKEFKFYFAVDREEYKFI